MVAYNIGDLQFILAQIKIAEQNRTTEDANGLPVAGIPLSQLVNHPLLPNGLRTVNGENNNIIPGRETWGSADQEFPRLTDPHAFTGTPGFDLNGSAPGGAVGTDYEAVQVGGPFAGQPASVADMMPRIISNLIVDQTLNNPAALMAALSYAGIEGAEATAARNLILTHYSAIKPLEAAAASAAAAVPGLLQDLQDAQGAIAPIIAADEAADATVDAYNAAIAAAPAAASSALALQTAFGLFNTDTFSLFDGTPFLVDASDLDALADTISAAQTAASNAAAVLSALEANIDVAQADIDAATAVVDAADLLVTNLQDLQSSLSEGQLLTLALFNDVQAIGNAVSTYASLAGDIGAELSDAGSLGAAEAVAAQTQIDRELAEESIVDTQDAYDDGVALAASTALAVTNNSTALNNSLAANDVVRLEDGSLVIPNVAPDEGISAPFNSWMTMFGQFFDHGLDLVEKAARSTVFIPLEVDDPLYDPNSTSNFMTVTRTLDNARNLTTPFVDQNQTYTSHASHQVFLREYVMVDGKPEATGRLLGGDNGGLATWADIKLQASEKLGITLTDMDILNVPLLATDEYGRFLRGPNGFAQAVVGNTLVEGDPSAPLSLGVPNTPGAATRTGHAFLDDISHPANPLGRTGPLTADANDEIGDHDIFLPGNVYDNELLDAHFITGDGRGNENIGLTAVHHVFHSEHNRLMEHTKELLLSNATTPEGMALLNEWLIGPDVTSVPTDLSTLHWDGERLFQTARVGTEMQYQHMVFEEFARKVNPMVDLFVFNPTMDINPAIFQEFAHVVYRFGHSMLNETVERLEADGQTENDIGLIEAFLNPVEFHAGGVSSEEAAGAIVRGMTRQQGNEIDEFVTDALRNNLVGRPLDLAAINIARGRETGMPTLNEARAQFHENTRSEWLKPYESWVDFAQNLKNPMSVVNFIAAYGTHSTILAATNNDERREAAMDLVFGGPGAPADRVAFLNSAAATSGVNDIDLWVGGLAESILPFGGMLGSTFTFVFELQMERLQNADRFYYLSRMQGTHFLQELENNSFASIVKKNTDLGDVGSTHLPGELFSTPEYILESNLALQTDYNGTDAGKDPSQEDEILAALEPKVVRDNNGLTFDGSQYENLLKFTGGEHVVLGGTEGNDVLISDLGDDTVWGDGGHDLIIGGHGINRLHGGDGDDIIYGGGDPEFIHGEEGNDVIAAGNGIGDLIFAGSGQDFVMMGEDAKETFGGEGNDFILGTRDTDVIMGGEGDDWIEGGEGFDGIAGDNSELFFNSTIIGHDVMFAGTNESDFDAESGDDIMVQGESVIRSEGMLGFDWVSYEEHTSFGADMDLNQVFAPTAGSTQLDILRNRFDRVEAVSGSSLNDLMVGDSRTNVDPEVGPDVNNPNAILNEATFQGDGLTVEGTLRVNGLAELLGFTPAQIGLMAQSDIVFEAGNILIGGGGSDRIEGRGGNDRIDGDKALNVRIGIKDANGDIIGSAEKMQGIVTMLDTNSPLHGKALDTLMFDRSVNPGNLTIIREIVDAGNTGDVDRAIFRGNFSDYTVTNNNDGTWTVAHIADVPPVEFDGTDIVSNVELLDFADQTMILDPNFVNNAPTGAPAIEFVVDNGIAGQFNIGDQLRATAGTLADADGFNSAGITFAWQKETAPGVWEAIENVDLGLPVTGPLMTIHPNMEVDGLRIRVTASFVDGHNIRELVPSLPTTPVLAIVPDPAVALGFDLTLAPNNVGPDGVAVEPLEFAPGPAIGIFEDVIDNDPNTNLTAFTFNTAQLLVNATTPLDETTVANLRIRVPDGVLEADIGVLTNNNDGTWSFDPAQDYNGGVVLLFDIVYDGVASPAEADLNVIAVNDAPVPAPDALGALASINGATMIFTADQLFGSMPIDINTGDRIDVDGETVTIVEGSVAIDPATAGTLTDNLDGTWTFVANGTFDGDVAVDFTLTDGLVEVAASTSLSLVGAGDNNVATGPLNIAVAKLLGNTQAGVLELGDTLTVAGLINDGDNTPTAVDFGDVTFTWQVEQTAGAGDFVNLVDPISGEVVTGESFTPTIDFEIRDLALRVVATFSDANNVQESVTTPNLVASEFPLQPTVAGLIGTPGDDILVGDIGNNTFIGNGGNDLLFGLSGNDTAQFSTTLAENFFDITPEGVLEVVNDGLAIETAVFSIENFQFADQTITLAQALATIPTPATGAPTLSDVGPTQGVALSALTAGIVDINGLTNPGFAFQWQQSVDGITWVNVAGATTANFTPLAAQVGQFVRVNVTFTDDLGTIETLSSASSARIVGTTQAQGAGAQTLTGNAGDDVLSGGGGNDIINANAGDDVITWNVGNGRDLVNGGTEATIGDTFIINGNNQAETYRIYSNMDDLNALLAGNQTSAAAAGLTGLAIGTEIVITRNGTNNASIIAELSEIEEIVINTGAGADVVTAIGNFTPTSLSFNTIEINDDGGDDTVDISDLSSGHHVRFNAGTGDDTFIGMRNQDELTVAAGPEFINITDTYRSAMQVDMSSLHGGSYRGVNVNDDLASTFMHTNNGANEWVALNLGSDFEITSLVLTNRDGSGYRLNDAVVSLLDANGNVVHTFDPIQDAQDGENFEFSLPTTVNARSVLVTGASNQYLHIAEIEVFGRALPETLVGMNLTDAYRSSMQVNMSSLHGSAYNAENINDDITTNFMHTNNGANEWVELNLGGNFDITYLDIVNRADGVGSRLNGAIVSLLNEQGAVVHSFAPIQSAEDGENFRLVLPNAMNAHSVRVVGAPNQYLHIAEIDVYGHDQLATTLVVPPTGQATFALTQSDIDGLHNLISGTPDAEGESEVPLGVRDPSNLNDGIENDQFIRLTSAHYGEPDANGNRAINPIFADLDARTISNFIGVQAEDAPKNAAGSNIFFMAFGQYFDHGLDFVAKGGNGTIEIGAPGMSVAADNPADLTRAKVMGFDANGVPVHRNTTSPFVDQNQAYGSHKLVEQFLRKGDGQGGLTGDLLTGAEDPMAPGFFLLPTFREAILHHWNNNTVFTMPDGSTQTFQAAHPGLVVGGLVTKTMVDGPTATFTANFMGSNQNLLLDSNPFISALDHYVAGDGRANENVSLTAMHTVWARNHNFHTNNLERAGFEGSAEELFQAARMLNEAEYQRVVFTEFADHLIGGIRGDGDHGFVEHNPLADGRISHEFAAAVYRVGHSLVSDTLTVLDPYGQPMDVKLVDAFLNPTNETLLPLVGSPQLHGHIPQPGYAQLGVGNILGGIATQQAEEIDFSIVDAVRNDLVRIRADLFAFNVARGWDVGLGTLNQVRADLMNSTNSYISEARSHLVDDLSPYTTWEDFQERNGLSGAVIAQFKAAYEDLVFANQDEIDAFVQANGDSIALHMDERGTFVAGIDRVDLWVGGLAEKHVNGGQVGQTFWVVLHEQFDRLQEADKFYYIDRFDNFDLYEGEFESTSFAGIVARNTGLEGLGEDIFATAGLGAEEEVAVEEETTTTETTLVVDEEEPAAIEGDEGTNMVEGTAEDNLLFGNGGRDALIGDGGNDVADGGAGDDTIFMGSGDDVVFGGEGDDNIITGAGNDIIFGDEGDDRAFGDEGDDTFMADDNDGEDKYFGDAGSDTLDMSAIMTNITVKLSENGGFAKTTDGVRDTLDGIENVITGSGDDTIIASSVVNVMDGGEGIDTFVFNTANDADGDVIENFEPGDKIDFGFMGTVQIVSGSPAAGQVAISIEQIDGEDYTIVHGQVDGTGAEFTLNIKGHHNLTSGNFN